MIHREPTITYGVWYASAGCLPDSDGPEFVGTLSECERYITDARAERDSDPEYDGTHDLYNWEVGVIAQYEPEQDDEPWSPDDDRPSGY